MEEITFLGETYEVVSDRWVEEGQTFIWGHKEGKYLQIALLE